MQKLALPSLLSSSPKSCGAIVGPPATATGNDDHAHESNNRIPSVEEFLARFDEQAASCLENAYL